MVEQRPIDLQRLWELAEEGKNAQEIMQEMNISDEAALKYALQNLVDEKGEDIHIAGLEGHGSVERSAPGTPKGRR